MPPPIRFWAASAAERGYKRQYFSVSTIPLTNHNGFGSVADGLGSTGRGFKSRKLFTHMCFCHQAVYTGHWAEMLGGWRLNRGPGGK